MVNLSEEKRGRVDGLVRSQNGKAKAGMRTKNTSRQPITCWPVEGLAGMGPTCSRARRKRADGEFLRFQVTGHRCPKKYSDYGT